MPVRTITDTEIALIKAMLARGRKNRDIQFYFNRRDRAVNSGRITQIASGAYSNSMEVSAATDEELDAFAMHDASAQAQRPDGRPTSGRDPVSPEILRSMFTAKGKTRHLIAGETVEAECKKTFSLRNAAAWMRAVAALANNRGGYVCFGVEDRGTAGIQQVVGLATKEFEETDPAQIATRLKSTFDPTPTFRRAILTIGGLNVGILYVEQHPSRPVIATKNVRIGRGQGRRYLLPLPGAVLEN